MPTTRSGAHYGPGALPKNTSTTKQLLPSKRKVKMYVQAKLQPSKIKASKIKQDTGKKKAAQYKKLPTKASATRAQKTSKIQAIKRKELVDKKRFSDPRIQPDGADYPDAGTVAENKPGYIFIQQQVDPENDNCPVDIYKIEVKEKNETLPQTTGCGAFKLILMPSTCCKVTSINEAKSAVCNALSEYTSRFKEGWFSVPEEELDLFMDLYNNAINDYKD